MTRKKFIGGAVALAGAVYGGYVARTWFRYGDPPAPGPGEEDVVLDHFMPRFDVVDRHSIVVNAAAEYAFEAAYKLDLMSSRVARSIFKGRELLLGARAARGLSKRQLVPAMKAIGWGELAEVAGREIVMGAVTQPWVADVVFRTIVPAEFAAFDERDFVKIAWTLRADPLTPATSVFRTETRAVAYGDFARSKFRLYWATLSPGIKLIRRTMLGPLKQEAEQLAIGRSV